MPRPEELPFAEWLCTYLSRGRLLTIRRSSFPLHDDSSEIQTMTPKIPVSKTAASFIASRLLDAGNVTTCARCGQFERRNSEFIFIPVAKSTKSARYLISHSPHLKQAHTSAAIFRFSSRRLPIAHQGVPCPFLSIDYAVFWQ